MILEGMHFLVKAVFRSPGAQGNLRFAGKRFWPDCLSSALRKQAGQASWRKEELPRIHAGECQLNNPISHEEQSKEHKKARSSHQKPADMECMLFPQGCKNKKSRENF